MKPQNYSKFIPYLLLFVMVSVWVKFFELGYRSFSLDELYGVCAALEPNFNQFLQNWIGYDSNPPLYYFFLRAWLRVFPATEFWVRMASVVLMLAAIYFFVTGIRKRFANNTWIWLLLLCGSSYGFLFFAQEARAYALLLLFTCLQLLRFIDLVRTENHQRFRWDVVWFAVFSVLSSYTHYTGILFSALLFAVLVWIHRNRIAVLRTLFIAIVISVAAGLLWRPYFWVILQIDKSFIVQKDYGIIKEILSMLFFGNSMIGKWISLLLLLGLPLVIYTFFKRRSATDAPQRMILVVGAIAMLVVLASPWIPYFYYYRHYLILIPVLLLALSVLFASVDTEGRFKSVFLVLAFAVVLAQAATHYQSKREEWRQVVKAVVDLNNGAPNTVAVIGEPWLKSHKDYLMEDPGYLNLAIRKKTFYSYYFGRFDPERKLDLVVVRPRQAEVQQYVNQQILKGRPIYLLVNALEESREIEQIALPANKKLYKKRFYSHILYFIL